MSKKLLTLFIASLCVITASAQTLFTYGKHAVDAREFLRAFNKNNTQPVVNKGKAVSDYLELYINSRLKIREAYDRKYDTLPQILSEVANLRAQIAENYMNNPEIITQLQQEAFQRSLKDIQVAHIFISFRNAGGLPDTAAARVKKEEVLHRLAMGVNFSIVAEELSDDPAAKTTRGDIGFITVFTLPYEFENVIYSTPVGKYSPVVTSKAGYHIFKNVAERKAIGKMKAQQILLAAPPGSDEAAKKRLAALADSLYKRIIAGDNFNSLATTFSSDYVTAVTGGTMPDISVGQYDPEFEKNIWSLPKDGAVSKPFLTSHGWHIVKRVAIIPVVTDINNKNNLQEIQTRILADSRSGTSRDFIYKKVMADKRYKKYPYSEISLQAYTDSILDGRPMKESVRDITINTPLFSLGDSVYTSTTWLTYAVVHRRKPEGGTKPYGELKEEFQHFALNNYYRDHLEDFNEEFSNQMTEFKDGNIFFEIMQQEIWNKAQTDTVALRALYEKNKKNYTWNQSADAVLFFCSDEATAAKLYEEVKKKPADWRHLVEQYSEKVVADSSRFEWSQLPNIGKMIPKAGLVTSPLVNTNDNTASFASIIQSHPQPMQRSFNEARGLVINDYQLVLEKQWTDALKKKYPVVINEAVLRKVSL